VSDATLAYDVMADVIPRDGVFLGEMHTVKQMRSRALWMPGISTRGETGAAIPSEGVLARAKTRARELIHSHKPSPLPDDTQRHLDEILARARRELTKD
jgi:trimethylamine:corrinoid methyltransferase-like protein